MLPHRRVREALCSGRIPVQFTAEIRLPRPRKTDIAERLGPKKSPSRLSVLPAFASATRTSAEASSPSPISAFRSFP
jgi:hypothetical protein